MECHWEQVYNTEVLVQHVSNHKGAMLLTLTVLLSNSSASYTTFKDLTPDLAAAYP